MAVTQYSKCTSSPFILGMDWAWQPMTNYLLKNSHPTPQKFFFTLKKFRKRFPNFF
jgi:hypothetical protein